MAYSPPDINRVLKERGYTAIQHEAEGGITHVTVWQTNRPSKKLELDINTAPGGAFGGAIEILNRSKRTSYVESPYLLAGYKEGEQAEFTGYSSLNMLAQRITSSFERAQGQVGVTPHSAFWNSIVRGNEDIGPATALGWHANELAQNITRGQIRFNIYGKDPNQPLYPSSIEKVQQELMLRAGTSAEEIKGTTGATYKDLGRRGYVQKGGFLIPIAQVSAIDIEGNPLLYLPGSPESMAKSLRRLGTLPPEALPLEKFQDKTSTYFERMLPKPATGVGPGYALLNMIHPGETQPRAVPTGNLWVTAVSGLPGAGIEPSNAWRPAAWGNTTTEDLELPIRNIGEFGDKFSYKFRNIIGKQYEPGTGSPIIGRYTAGGVERNLTLRPVESAPMSPLTQTMIVPAWKDSVSGEFLPFQRKGALPVTQEDLANITKRTGLPAQAQEGYSNVQMSVTSLYKTAQKVGGTIKAGLVQSGMPQEVMGVPIDLTTGELKSSLAITQDFFASRSREQMSNILNDYAQTSGIAGADRLAGYYHKHFLLGNKNPTMEELATQLTLYGEGQKGAVSWNGQQLGAQLFGMIQGHANPEYTKSHYGAFKAPAGSEIVHGAMNPESITWAISAYQAQHPGASIAEARMDVARRFHFEDPTNKATIGLEDAIAMGKRGVLPLGYEKPEQNSMVLMGQPLPRMMEWAARSTRLNYETATYLSGRFPNFMSGIGVNNRNIMQLGKMESAEREVDAYVKWHLTLSKGGSGSPDKYQQINSSQMSNIGSWLYSTEGQQATDEQKIAYIRATIGAGEGPLITEPNEEGIRNILPRPELINELQYSNQFGESVGNITALYAGTFSGASSPERLFKVMQSRLAAKSEAYKNAWGIKVPSGWAGRFTGLEALAPNEIYLPPSERKRMLRSMGVGGKDIQSAMLEMEQLGDITGLGLRIPVGSRGQQVAALHLVTEKALRSRIANPVNRALIPLLSQTTGLAFTSQQFAALGKGDLDLDNMMAIFGIARSKEGHIIKTDTTELGSVEVKTTDEAVSILARMGLNIDEDIPTASLNTIDELLKKPGMHTVQEVMEAFFKLGVSEIGRGTTYNIQRIFSPYMAMAGYKPNQIDAVHTAMQQVYSAALDNWNVKNKRELLGGTLTSAISTAEIRMGDNGPYLHLGTRIPKTGKDQIGNLGYNWSPDKLIQGGVEDLVLNLARRANEPLELKNGDKVYQWTPEAIAQLFTGPGGSAHKLQKKLEKVGPGNYYAVLAEETHKKFAGAKNLEDTVRISNDIMELPVIGATLTSALVRANGDPDAEYAAKEFFRKLGTSGEQIEASATLARIQLGKADVSADEVQDALRMMPDGSDRESLVQAAVQRGIAVPDYQGKTTRPSAKRQVENALENIVNPLPARTDMIGGMAKKRGRTPADDLNSQIAYAVNSALSKINPAFGRNAGIIMDPEDVLKKSLDEILPSQASRMVGDAIVGSRLAGNLLAGDSSIYKQLQGAVLSTGLTQSDIEGQSLASQVSMAISTPGSMQKFARTLGPEGFTNAGLVSKAFKEASIGMAVAGRATGYKGDELKPLAELTANAQAREISQLGNLNEIQTAAGKEEKTVSVSGKTVELAANVSAFHEYIKLFGEHGKSLKEVNKALKDNNTLTDQQATAIRNVASMSRKEREALPGQLQASATSDLEAAQRQGFFGAAGGVGGGGTTGLGTMQQLAGGAGETPAGKSVFSGMGSIMRRAFGGWGLMYMENIGRAMMSGTDYGSAEAQAQYQQSAAIATTMLGAPTLGTTYAQKITSAKAAVGGVSATEAANLYLAQHPGVNQSLNVGKAGAFAFAGAEWLTSDVLANIIAPEAALPISLAVAGGAMLGNAALGVAGQSKASVGNWLGQNPSVMRSGLTPKAFTNNWQAAMSYQNAINLGDRSTITKDEQSGKLYQASYNMAKNGGSVPDMMKALAATGIHPAAADVTNALTTAFSQTYGSSDLASSTLSGMLQVSGTYFNPSEATRLLANADTGYNPVSGIAQTLISNGMLPATALTTAQSMYAGKGGTTPTAPEQAAVTTGEQYIQSLPSWAQPKIPTVSYAQTHPNGLIGPSPATGDINAYQALMQQYAFTPMQQQYGQGWVSQQATLQGLGAAPRTLTPGEIPQNVTQQMLTGQSAITSYAQSMQQALYNGNPMAWTNVASAANTAIPNLNLQTSWGQAVPNQYLGMTGINQATGMPNGQAWGETSLAMYRMPAQAVARQIWNKLPGQGSAAFSLAQAQGAYGQYGGAAINAMTNGINDQGTMLYGQQALQYQQGEQQYAFSAASAGIQMTGALSSLAFATGKGISNYNNVNPQTGQPFNIGAQSYGFNVPGYGSYQSAGGGTWGIEDAQRYLGYAQQQVSFGFQQQGINLQARQFQQSMGLQAQGMALSRAQGTEEFQYGNAMSAQQFGFSQTMFRETSRFDSGRQRRLDEMQNKENVTEYNMQKDQRAKEFGFQKQQWALQEAQYKLQIQQFGETKKLQQEQLNANKAFWGENKKLTEAAVQLQRADFIESNKLQQKSAEIAAAAAKAQEELNANMVLYNKYNGDAQGLLTNLNTALLAASVALLKTNPAMAEFVTQIERAQGAILGGSAAGWGGEGKPQDAAGGFLPMMGAASGVILPGLFSRRTAVVGEGGFEFVHGNRVMSHAESGSKLDQYMSRQMVTSQNGGGKTIAVPINVYIGNDKLQSYIVQAVIKEM